MTLTGKLGTLVARNRVGFIEVPDGLSVFTGSWKVIRGTGALRRPGRRRTRSRRGSRRRRRHHQGAVPRLPPLEIAKHELGEPSKPGDSASGSRASAFSAKALP